MNTNALKINAKFKFLNFNVNFWFKKVVKNKAKNLQ